MGEWDSLCTLIQVELGRKPGYGHDLPGALIHVFTIISQEMVRKCHFAYMYKNMRLLMGLRLETLTNPIQSADSEKFTYRVPGDKVRHCVLNSGHVFRL